MAIFKSTYEALTFAFNYNGTNIKPVLIGPPPKVTGRGLGGLDGAAEAGNVKRIIHGLGAFFENFIIARFAPKTVPCACRRRCCRGWYTNPEWWEAVIELSKDVQDACFDRKCEVKYQQELVARYFLKEVERRTLKEISDDFRISESTVKRHWSFLVRFLGSKDKRHPGREFFVMKAADEALTAEGVVGVIDGADDQ